MHNVIQLELDLWQQLEAATLQPEDARALSASAQEALRYRVVKAVHSGMSKSEAAPSLQHLSYCRAPLD